MKTAIGEINSELLLEKDQPRATRNTPVDREESFAFPRSCSAADRSRLNPFSVSFVQPGAIPFIFEPEYLRELELRSPDAYQNYFYESLAQGREVRTGIGLLYLADRFRDFGYRAQLTGPHGGGKSTLMQELANLLGESGHSIFYRSLHDRQRAFPDSFYDQIKQWLARPKPQGNRIIFLDGYEKLFWLHRFSFRYFCQTHRLGLLVSAHSHVFGMPILYRTKTSSRTLRLILEYLLDEMDYQLDDRQVAMLFGKHRGDIRKILFALYDEYEQRRIFQ